jgi:ATP-binding protein involved in chromosome partitioning
MPIEEQQVLTALRTVKDPELFKDIVVLGRVKEFQIDETTLRLRMDWGTTPLPTRNRIEADVKAALVGIGATAVDFQSGGEAVPAAGAPAPAAGKSSALPQVKYVVAVGAGKGGVGKSTLALNIAIGLHRKGLEVGVMDGDIYGPSMPTMLGIRGLQPQVYNGKILPFAAHGIHAVTMGSLVEQDKPLIWRGPMAHGAFKQLLLDNTRWPALDYLIVDLPPGTGDVPLTLCQLLPMTGAVIVATPQQVALDDAIRAVKMFEHLETPILGLVENMSYIPLPDGTVLDLFGRGGTEKCAQQLGLPYLGAVPMYTELRVNSDAGTPINNFESSPGLKSALELIVDNLMAQVAKRSTGDVKPVLNIL